MPNSITTDNIKDKIPHSILANNKENDNDFDVGEDSSPAKLKFQNDFEKNKNEFSANVG